MPWNKEKLSEQAKEAQKALKEKNKKRQNEQKALIKAALMAQEKQMADALQPFYDAKEQRDAQKQLQIDQLYNALQKSIEQLLSPDAMSYIEWRTGMMRIANGAGALNAYIFHNRNITFMGAIHGLVFHGGNISNNFHNAKLGLSTRKRKLREFIGKTGVFPQNFDPQFSMHATMEDGKAFGKLYSGEDAKEIFFVDSDDVVSPADMYLAGYLKEKKGMDMILNPQSPDYRRIIDTKAIQDRDIDVLKQFYLQNSHMVKPFVTDKANLPDNYQIEVKRIVQNQFEPDRLDMVVERKFVDEHNVKHVDEITIELDLDDLAYHEEAHCFVSLFEDDALAREIQFAVQAPKITTQEQMDALLGEDFLSYCQDKINASVVDFQVKINFVENGDNPPQIQLHQVINGKEEQFSPTLRQSLLEQEIDYGAGGRQTLLNAIQNQIAEVVAENDLLVFEAGQYRYANRYAMPDDALIREKIEENAELGVNERVEVDTKHKKITITTSGGDKETYSYQLKDQDASKSQLSIVIKGKEIMASETIIMDKPRQILTAEQANTEIMSHIQNRFGEQLAKPFEGTLNPAKDEHGNPKPVTLLAYNPDVPVVRPGM